MSIPSSVKRQLAEECFLFAMKGDFEQAARIRQQAYTASPPGSIGLDWSSWNEVWGKDSRYIKFLLNEDFSDCDNSQAKIHSIQAGIFIDYLFDFRDCWGVKQQALIINGNSAAIIEKLSIQTQKRRIFQPKSITQASMNPGLPIQRILKFLNMENTT